MPENVLLAEVEGPKGTAEIFEVTVSTGKVLEVVYEVVMGDEKRSAPSFGEAHLLANELVGVQQGV